MPIEPILATKVSDDRIGGRRLITFRVHAVSPCAATIAARQSVPLLMRWMIHAVDATPICNGKYYVTVWINCSWSFGIDHRRVSNNRGPTMSDKSPETDMIDRLLWIQSPDFPLKPENERPGRNFVATYDPANRASEKADDE